MRADGRSLPGKNAPDGSMSSNTDSGERISLIIPCHNAGRYIAEALETALGQSMVPDEIVVVDDGSTDDSAGIVERFKPHVRLIRQTNQGGPSARNVGLDNISGSLVAFLDADDLWPTDSLKGRFDALTASPNHDYAYGRMEQFVSPEIASRLAVPAPSLRGAIARVLGGTLFRRRVFDDVGGFNPEIRLGYMLEWLSKVETAGYRGLPLAQLVLRRRIHDSNSGHQEEQQGKSYLRALRSSLLHRRSIAN